MDQEKFLPIANIGRIMKDALPKDKEAKIAKDARETVQECVSDFISFITSEACEKCMNDKRRTINGNDLIYAMRQLGFERYLENIQLYYDKYQETCKKASELQNTSRKNNNAGAAQKGEMVNNAGLGGLAGEDEDPEEEGAEIKQDVIQPRQPKNEEDDN